MPTKNFTVTPEQIERFRVQLAGHGITLPEGNEGQVNDTKDGVILQYTYDGTTNLVLGIIKKPWYAPTDSVWRALSEYMGE